MPSHGPVARDQRRTLVAVRIHSPLTTHHSPLATRNLPSAIPDSEFGDPELGPLCMHDILRFATFTGSFSEFLESRRFPRKLMMGNGLDRNCPGLAPPAHSWRNFITNKGFAVFFPSSSCFPKAAHTCYVLLHVGYVSCYVSATFPATYRLRFLLRISYVSAIKRPGQPLSGIRNEAGPRSLS